VKAISERSKSSEIKQLIRTVVWEFVEGTIAKKSLDFNKYNVHKHVFISSDELKIRAETVSFTSLGEWFLEWANEADYVDNLIFEWNSGDNTKKNQAFVKVIKSTFSSYPAPGQQLGISLKKLKLYDKKEITFDDQKGQDEPWASVAVDTDGSTSFFDRGWFHMPELKVGDYVSLKLKIYRNTTPFEKNKKYKILKIIPSNNCKNLGGFCFKNLILDLPPEVRSDWGPDQSVDFRFFMRNFKLLNVKN